MRVNKGRIKATYRLKAGDVVRIPPVRRSAPNEQQAISPGLRQLLLDAILYEDDDLLILDKPSGLAVHGGSGIQSGLIESIRTIKPAWATLELAHRIDRETSGCLILAKQRSSLNALHDLFREGQINKGYLTLVAGIWDSDQNIIDVPLDRNGKVDGERTVQVSEQGKSAISHFKLLSIYRGQLPSSMLEVRIDTGRTHQIRVHAAHAGHPAGMAIGRLGNAGHVVVSMAGGEGLCKPRGGERRVADNRGPHTDGPDALAPGAEEIGASDARLCCGNRG